MSELTLEQQQAIALAKARLRLQQKKEPPPIAGGVDPTEGMGGFDKFAAGMGKAVSDTGLGIRQLASYVGIGDADELNQEAAERRQRDKALMDTGAGFAGNLAGNVGLTLAPGGAVALAGKALKAPGAVAAGKALLAPQTIRGGAAAGAGYGALQPTENVAERVGNITLGGVTGGAVPALFTAGRTAKATVEPMYEQGQRQILGRLLRSAAGENADDAMRAMQGASELVPGSVPTAGQVANSGGIAALERAASQANPEAYAARQLEQNAARISALRGVAGDQQQMGWMQGVRSMMTEIPYEQAKNAKVPVTLKDRAISSIMERPSMQAAWQRAEQLAREAGDTIVSNKGELSGKGLHYVKMALDDMIETAPQAGIGSAEQRALQTTRAALLDWMEKKIPEYATARQSYAQWSRPVNQMQIGQALADKLEPALTQGGTPIRMNAETYARALREGDVLARKATGFPGATMEGVMDPQQLQVLNAIKDDLARSATASTLGRGAGSNTFQNLAQENLLNQAGVHSLPQLLSRPVQLTNYALRSVYGAANRDMQKKLAEALLNPQEAAAMMAAASPQERAFLAQALRGLTPVGVATPGLVNANQ